MYYSMKTRNKSFINMWRYLQRNSVENNLFMLQTHDKDLVDFSIEKYQSMDREDPSFKIYRSKVIEEARNNIWFYFRELIMIPDESMISGYKHFELTPEFMMMIYLYDKKKSFISLNSENNLCLQFIWNLHRSLYNNDLVLINDYEEVMRISEDVKKHIANMSIQVPFGSTQAISDSIDHYLACDLEALKYYDNNLMSIILTRYMDFYRKNVGTSDTDNEAIFILEDDMNLMTYSHVSLLSKEKFLLYVNCPANRGTIDYRILCNFLVGLFPFAHDGLYDIDESQLEKIYLI